MANFSTLKRNRKTDLEKLSKKLQELNTTTYNQDERFWLPTVDKAGNGSAIIRFLPSTETEDLPFIRFWKHSFQHSSGSWYIENCPTTLKKDCPVCEMNSKLWKAGSEGSAERKQVSIQKRKLYFVSNIYVIKDPGNPDNEGKVFLYQYGKKIFDKLNAKMNPDQDLGEEAINPFDLWEGANFRLKIRKVDDQRNYDQSEFTTPSPLSTHDDELEKIYNQVYALNEFVDPKLFKNYNELSERLMKVSGMKSSSKSKEDDHDDEKENVVEYENKERISSLVKNNEEEDDDEQTLSFFKKLAQEDD